MNMYVYRHIQILTEIYIYIYLNLIDLKPEHYAVMDPKHCDNKSNGLYESSIAEQNIPPAHPDLRPFLGGPSQTVCHLSASCGSPCCSSRTQN